MRSRMLRLAGVAAALLLSAATAPPILIQDVKRFFMVYDAAGGHPTAAQLQRDYIDPGTPGLHQFASIRDLSGDTLAAAIARHPDVFVKARRCMAILPRVIPRVDAALWKLGRLYPEATYPPVTLLVGRATTGGTTSAGGVLIGLETICAADYINPDIEDRFVYLIAHEYAHVQQPLAQIEDPKRSLLTNALVEGGAEFIDELISGSVANRQLPIWAKGREKAIETEFAAAQDGNDPDRKWIYNGAGTPDRPGDLAYWVGYRIVKSYYRHAADKRAAIRAILQVRDTAAFQRASGWYPGIVLK